MVFVTPTQPHSLAAKVTLRGVGWQTFKALMNDLEEQDYRISYASDALEIIAPLTEFASEEAESEVMPVVTLYGIRWQTYKALMAEAGDSRAWRIAYASGVLEIRMPLINHEEPKGLIEDFVGAIADELEIEVRKLGALTLEREDVTCAVEPDSCFYIANEQRVRGLQVLSFPKDPPPDLVIESDNTRSSINKFEIYAVLAVPELWRYRRKTLEVYHLIDGKYERSNKSRSFPFLPIDEIPVLIEQSQEVGQRSVVRLFRQRIRGILEQQADNF